MESEFQRMQRQATEEIRRLSARAEIPPSAPAVQEKKQENKTKKDAPLDVISSLFSGSGDSLLLVGLLLLLFREKGDNILMLAILYILM